MTLPLSNDDYIRIARKLWGDDALDEKGDFYPESSDEVEAILAERIRELEATLASPQALQLELIRRNRFNAFDGERVHADLLAHRELYTAVLMDRLGVREPIGIPPASMIKLRDLPDGEWNVDTLYILAKDEPSARGLAELGEPWIADATIVHDERETERALGSGGIDGARIVSMWWD